MASYKFSSDLNYDKNTPIITIFWVYLMELFENYPKMNILKTLNPNQKFLNFKNINEKN